MNRRKFLAVTLMAPAVCRTGFLSRADADDSISTPAAAAAPDWRRFEITTRVVLPNSSGPAQLWLPLAQTAGGYQNVLDLRWKGSGYAERIHDTRYGAQILHAVWDGKADESPQIEVVQTVTTRDRRATPFLPLTQAERQFWTAPTASVPTDGIVLETARRITAGMKEPRAKLRAIYDWVVDHTYRDPDTPGCGIGDFERGLASGKLGGKCADISSLMTGLSRAAGFPARDVYGLRVADSRIYPCLGRSGDVSKAQHCRSEVFLENEGWIPVDPADVRKVVLEQKLVLDSPEGRALREQLFGFWEMNWIGYNSATDIDLPAAKGTEKPDFAFLMYPHAITTAGIPSCLDPTRFRYEITSRVLT